MSKNAEEKKNAKSDRDLVKEVYETDEFRLYCYKILPCPRKIPHEWSACPFAHTNEKAKRRDIRTHQYDCEMCPAVAKGEECPKGTNCPHSHNIFESWLHPQKYRTLLCKDKDNCTRPVCFFAHSVAELRIPTEPEPAPQTCSSLMAASAVTAEVAGSVSFIRCNPSTTPVGNQGHLMMLPQTTADSAAVTEGSWALPAAALAPAAAVNSMGPNQLPIAPFVLVNPGDQTGTAPQLVTPAQCGLAGGQAGQQPQALYAVMSQGATGVYQTAGPTTAGLDATALPAQHNQPVALLHYSEAAAGTAPPSVPSNRPTGVDSRVLQLPMQQLMISDAAIDAQQHGSFASSGNSNTLLWLPASNVSAGGMASQRLYQAAAIGTSTVPSGATAALSWNNAFQDSSDQAAMLTAATAVLDPPGLLYGAGGQAVSDLAVNNTPAACYVAVNTAGGVNHGGGYTLVNQGGAVLEAPQGSTIVPSDPLQINTAGQIESYNMLAPPQVQYVAYPVV